MQIVLDGSGSMDGVKWQAASGALLAFFDDLAKKNDYTYAVGLFLFDGTQDVHAFSVPDVPIRQVDAPQHAELASRIQGSTPAGGTPLKLALQGQVPILEAFVPIFPLKPSGKKVLVVITDGVPDGPPDVLPAVKSQCAQLVKDARAS